MSTREILFRGKRLDNGEWIEGYYMYHINRTICPAGDSIKPDDVEHIILFDGFSDWNMPRGINYKHVLPETVCRYTGLTDKNGRKIFEGDYISCKQYIGGNQTDFHVELGYVEMKYGAFGLHRKQGYYRPFKDWLEDYEFEVIGNIFEDPELLN